MTYRQNNFNWDVLGTTFCLPQVAPQIGWVLPNAEARGAKGSSESLSSLSSGNFLPSPSNDFNEDALSGHSLFEDGFSSQASFSSGEEVVDFDFNFLPSSPESVDFSYLNYTDEEMLPFDFEDLSDMLADKHPKIIRKPIPPDNTKVEQAVEDPEVALNLMQQLGDGQISFNFISTPSIQNAFDARFVPLNVLPLDNSSFIQSQSLDTSPAFDLVSVAPTEALPFDVNSFLTHSFGLHVKVAQPFNNINVSPAPMTNAFTLRDLISMPDLHQAILPSSPTHSYVSPDASVVDSISFADIHVPHMHKSHVIRPEKRLRKKEQNKNAAQKYREKKRQEQGSFFNEWQDVEKRNSELKLRVTEITREISYLKGLLHEISVT